MPEAIITQEMRGAIGKVLNTVSTLVEYGMIRRYLVAMEEKNPVYCDEQYARSKGYPGIIAPPGLLTTSQFVGGSIAQYLPFKEPLTRGLDGGAQYEFFKSVRPGDTITATRRLSNIERRESKTFGKMILMDFDETFVNQKGETVMKGLRRNIRY